MRRKYELHNACSWKLQSSMLECEKKLKKFKKLGPEKNKQQEGGERYMLRVSPQFLFHLILLHSLNQEGWYGLYI